MTFFLGQLVILFLMGVFFSMVFTRSIRHQIGDGNFSYTLFAIEFVCITLLAYILLRIGYPLGNSYIVNLAYLLGLSAGIGVGFAYFHRASRK